MVVNRLVNSSVVSFWLNDWLIKENHLYYNTKTLVSSSKKVVILVVPPSVADIQHVHHLSYTNVLLARARDAVLPLPAPSQFSNWSIFYGGHA